LDYPKVKENNGRFSHRDLKEIWSADTYQNKINELLALMKKFKLCYELPQGQHYIAPQRLQVDKPDGYEWDSTNSLQLKYRYAFMPKGIVTRLIVEMHQDIKDETVWNTGMVIERNGATAEIREIYGDNTISASVKGDHPERLRTIVMTQIDKINDTFEHLKVAKLVPCNCKTCNNSQQRHFYKEEDLLIRKKHGKRTIECKFPPFAEVKVLELLNGIAVRDTGWDGNRRYYSNTGEIKQLLSKDKIEEALLIMEEFGMISNSIIVQFQGRLSALKEKEKLGKISRDDLETERNKIRYSIIDDFLNGG
jgi:hypothetical protein